MVPVFGNEPFLRSLANKQVIIEDTEDLEVHAPLILDVREKKGHSIPNRHQPDGHEKPDDTKKDDQDSTGNAMLGGSEQVLTLNEREGSVVPATEIEINSTSVVIACTLGL